MTQNARPTDEWFAIPLAKLTEHVAKLELTIAAQEERIEDLEKKVYWLTHQVNPQW